MKKQFISVLALQFLLPTALSAANLWDELTTNGGLQSAITYNPNPHKNFLGLPEAKEIGPDRFHYELRSNGVTSADRTELILKLQLANFALKRGYGYFNVELGKITGRCSITGLGMQATTVLPADSFMSKEPIKGMIDAKKILSMWAAPMMLPASLEERKASMASWCHL